MKLRSDDGTTTVEITPVGYELAVPDRHDDDEWLRVRIGVEQVAGEFWTVTHPCLTVSELIALTHWLRSPHTRSVEFVEPLVALRRAPDADGVVEVAFSHEALPPSLQVGEPRDWLGGVHVLQFRISQDVLTVAADALAAEAAEFPARQRSGSLRRPRLRA
ncbi:WapI family immunity protein [Nocardioides yefusunii]|uniref:Uncharacterized protein n=1 Tax=Nocardioides yefusunii TaxID=2500546 RepID=A0ABW1QYE5_9ACTN|nr:hypothetical protein [Nocardioides yefusunii]